MVLDGYEICAVSENVEFFDALMATPIPKKLLQLSNTGTLTGFWVIDFQDKKIFWPKELIQIWIFRRSRAEFRTG